MKKPSSLTELVACAGNDLTPTNRRIAEAVLADPTLLAFGTVADLADKVGTSRPSVVRFANKLGFDGYSELQRFVRTEVSRKLARPSQRIRSEEKTHPLARQAIHEAIDSVFQAAQEDRIARLVRPIVDARHVWILTGETSRAGAMAFHSGLSMIRPNVHLPEDRSLGSELSHARKKDVAVVFDFYRYRKLVVNATKILARTGVPIVAITDGPLSPLVEFTDNWCEITVPAIGPFDSSVPVVAIAELMVARVARELKDKTADRIDRIESLWEQTEVFFE
ncbi:MAG: MurR/RpiR family transcriptional regulator [Phycisphaeraceae bacterium]